MVFVPSCRMTKRGRRRRWSDLSPRAQTATVLAGLVQLGLLSAALADLRRRDPAQVRGPRWVWGLASLINFVGPISYFVFGRRPRPGGGASTLTA